MDKSCHYGLGFIKSFMEPTTAAARSSHDPGAITCFGMDRRPLKACKDQRRLRTHSGSWKRESWCLAEKVAVPPPPPKPAQAHNLSSAALPELFSQGGLAAAPRPRYQQDRHHLGEAKPRPQGWRSEKCRKNIKKSTQHSFDKKLSVVSCKGHLNRHLRCRRSLAGNLHQRHKSKCRCDQAPGI